MNSKVNSIQVQVGLSSPMDIGVTFFRKPDFRADGIPNNASYWTYDWHIDGGHRSADFRERRYLRAISAQRALMARMVAPAPLPVDDTAPAVTFAEPDNRFELAGWDEPTADEVTRFWSDGNADERADVIREAKYGKQL